MKTIRFAAAFAALAAVSGPAFAGSDADWEAKIEEKFAAMDADGDGAVTQAEYLAYASASAAEGFAAKAGDDSALSLAELKAAMKSHHEAGGKSR